MSYQQYVDLHLVLLMTRVKKNFQTQPGVVVSFFFFEYWAPGSDPDPPNRCVSGGQDWGLHKSSCLGAGTTDWLAAFTSADQEQKYHSVKNGSRAPVVKPTPDATPLFSLSPNLVHTMKGPNSSEM